MKLLAILSLAAAAWAAAPEMKKNQDGLVMLNDRRYDELTAVPRDHYTVVLLTALGAQFGCHFCKESDPQYKIMGASIAKAQAKRGKNDPEIVMAHMDFDSGQRTFQKLQIASAPNLFIYPPSTGPHAKDGNANLAPATIHFDFAAGSGPEVAERAMAWISSTTGTHMAIERPFDYGKFLRMVTSIVVIVASLYVLYNVAGNILYSRHFWAVISIGAILIFNGGQMYTQIRHMPYSTQGGYVAKGFQEQFGAEVHIVAATYALLAFSTISLAVSVPRIKHENTQAMLVGVWLVIQVMVYSFLLQLFRQKNGSYPFKLFL